MRIFIAYIMFMANKIYSVINFNFTYQSEYLKHEYNNFIQMVIHINYKCFMKLYKLIICKCF